MGIRRGKVSAARVALAAAALAPGCSKFDGPYPCNPGYASCSTADQCETNVTIDPLNCSACGKSCLQGALCENRVCSVGPTVLSTAAYPGPLAVNSTTVFFWSSMTNVVQGVRKNSGATFTALSPQQGGGPNFWPFVVDDARIYYVAQNVTGMGGSYLAASPSDGSAGQPTVVGTFSTPNSGGAPSAMVLSRGTIFGIWNVNGSERVWSVPTSGGTIADVATLPNSNGGVAVDASGVYTVVTNGPCEIDRVTLPGGKPTTLAANIGGCPSSLASDGSSVYWANTFSMNSNGNNGSGSQCVLQVSSVSVTSGTPTTLASIDTNETPYQVAVDASDVYVATNASLWKIAISGAAPTRIAGNLGAGLVGGSGPNGCNNGGGGGGSIPVALALDDMHIYLIVSPSPGNPQGVLLEVSK
jgi:hypothetical protein